MASDVCDWGHGFRRAALIAFAPLVLAGGLGAARGAADSAIADGQQRPVAGGDRELVPFPEDSAFPDYGIGDWDFPN